MTAQLPLQAELSSFDKLISSSICRLFQCSDSACEGRSEENLQVRADPRRQLEDKAAEHRAALEKKEAEAAEHESAATKKEQARRGAPGRRCRVVCQDFGGSARGVLRC